jgi:hypothetical protein
MGSVVLLLLLDIGRLDYFVLDELFRPDVEYAVIETTAKITAHGSTGSPQVLPIYHP